jgi:hypothetical protein
MPILQMYAKKERAGMAGGSVKYSSGCGEAAALYELNTGSFLYGKPRL